MGSFYAERNLPRKRGRIFLGPLNLNALAQNTARPHAGVITALAEAMHALSFSGAGEFLALWGVLSTVAGPQINVVSAGWVDDAFDTQRRRGIESSSRTTFIAA